MKRLLPLFIFVFVSPLSAIIVNGYKYTKGYAIIYFLSDIHIENQLKSSSPILNDQVAALKKLFETLLQKQTCGFFVECDTDKVELLGQINEFLKNLSKDNAYKTKIILQNEEGLSKEFTNTHNLIVGGKCVQLARDLYKEEFKEENLVELRQILNERKFDPKCFLQEIEKLKKKTNKKLTKLTDYVKNSESTPQVIFKNLCFATIFMNNLGAVYNLYREKLIRDFIKKSIKENKITIVIAGDNHIQAIRQALNNAMNLVKEIVLFKKRESASHFITLKRDDYYFQEQDFNELFGSGTTWQWLQNKAWEWRKTLIPVAAAGVGLATRWWFNKNAKPSSSRPYWARNLDMSDIDQKHWWLKFPKKD